MKRILPLLSFLAALFAVVLPARAARVKDLVEIEGFRGNALVGYGLVVGLQGTGDDARSVLTRRSIARLMLHLGIQIDESQLKAKNVAAVLVTAELPPFAKPGAEIDVTVSSIGTAKSLSGGTLVLTPLKGPDKNTYVLAQGSLSVGGFAAEGGSGSSSRKGHTTVASIPSGGTVERRAPGKMPEKNVVLLLADADYTTASRIADAIESRVEGGRATVKDAGTIVVDIPSRYHGRVASLIAKVEALEVDPDVAARVVIDERTGTIVVGAGVTLGKAAIAHGGITIKIQETPRVSQPSGGIFPTGDTVVVPDSNVDVQEEGGELRLVNAAPDVGDVAAALNGLGVKPRDLVAIFRALKAAGALTAELEIL